MSILSLNIRKNEIFVVFVLVISAVSFLAQLGSLVWHVKLGEFVVVRDIILVMSFGGLIPMAWLHCSGRIQLSVIIIILSSVALVSLTLFGYDPSIVIQFKWLIIWAVSYLMGGVLIRFGWSHILWSLVIIVMSYVLILGMACLWEVSTGNYVISADYGTTSYSGADLAVSQKLKLGADSSLRARGFERSVFSAADVLSVGVLLSVAACIHSRGGRRVLLSSYALVNCIIIIISGGRSQFIGLILATVFAIGIFIRIPRRWFVPALASAFLLLALIISFMGIGTVIGWVQDVSPIESRILNSGSAYMRDDVWGLKMEEVHADYGSILIGHVLLTAFEGGESFKICDNQYLWVLYHYGYVLGGGILLFFMYILYGLAGSRSCYSFFALILIFYLMGNGLARESLFFFGSSMAALFIGANTQAESS